MRRILAALIFAASVALAGCGPTGELPSTLGGTTWVATQISGQAPVAGREPSITFDGDRISGNAGCNGFSGRFRIEGSTIAIQDLGSTAMGCPEPAASMERMFLNALGGASSIQVGYSTLVIGGEGGDVVMEYAIVPGGIPHGT
jgi:heat shock protein HslJ